ncbi:MAG: NAD(P)/FAD-dependent oxidoreductase [Thermoleophilia bacterium]|nr:NAD(P)/FAD-dependent oxidoreductase [Thermoleophilia bacterium]
MYTCRYPHLFSPIKLADRYFRNRLFAAPIGYEYLSSRNYPLEETIAFYERRAQGGAASVCVGSAAVDSKRGVIGLSNLYLDDPTSLPPIYRLASAINRHGAVAAVELQHCGPNSYICAARGEQIYGALDGVNPLGQFVPAMPEELILQTIEAFANAAAYAKFCGFGMVTIHAGHGWLLNQFLDPHINKRNDQWGGSRENRCRFLLAIIQRIKEKCGRGFPVEVRISGSMCHESGYDIDEGVAIAQMLDGKADLIHVSAGSHEVPEVFTVTHPSMFLPDGPNVIYAAEIKKHVKTPVATVGGLGDPELMEEIIASGKADVVQAARALLADPDLPKKARAGKADEVRPCLRCFQCFAGITTKRQNRCAVNPEIGLELYTRHGFPATTPKKVLVVGGGIAGMQAALTAAHRGHEVILCEKSSRLGGVLRVEENVPFKRLLARYLDYQERMLYRSPVRVHLNTEVTPEIARQHEPDVLIAALGARPVRPAIPGIERPNVYTAEQLYVNPELAGASVVVVGGGLVGIELAIFLAGLGRRVVIVEMMNALSDGGNPVHALALLGEIRRHGIEVWTSTRAVEITSTGVLGEYVGDAYSLPSCPTVQAAVLQSNTFSQVVRGEAKMGERTLIEAETVAVAVGYAPLHEEADAFRFCAPVFYQIGDCDVPANIFEAVRTAWSVANDI